MSTHNARHAKLAAQALEVLPELVEKNAAQEAELAQYKRKDRIQKLASVIAGKGWIGEHEIGLKIAELEQKDDDYLDKLEVSLEHIGVDNLKLGSEAEDDDQDGEGVEDGLTRLLKSGDPEDY